MHRNVDLHLAIVWKTGMHWSVSFGLLFTFVTDSDTWENGTEII